MTERVRNKVVPTLPCACANLRRAARVVTALYDEELRPAGLRSTQFVLLQVLAEVGEMIQRDLGGMLAIDSTTLTRSLGLLARRGLLEHRPGSDRRERFWQLTIAGRREYRRLERYRERAEAKLRKAMGEEDWNRLSAILERVVRAAEDG
jgi:DNA-binding MarR family transcriptional regulator